MAKLAATDETQFIKITKTQQVTDFQNFVGFNFGAEKFILLESGRIIGDTTKWNPLTYALVFNQTDLINHILSTGRNLNEMLALGLNLRDIYNGARHSKSELIDAQIETLMLLVENKSPNFIILLTGYNYLFDKKLF